METALYYQHSGKVPAKALVLTLVFLPLTAWFCAWAYVNLVWYIPFVFLNFVLTIIFSMLACIPVYFGVSDGHIRNVRVVKALCIFSGLLFVYLQWAFYSAYISGLVLVDLPGSPARPELVYFLAHPGAMISLASRVLDVGMWSLMGAHVSGIPLLLFWIAEAACSIGFGLYFILDQLKCPYSETMNAWLNEERAPRGLKPLEIPVEEIRSKLETGDVNFLAAALAANPHDKLRYEIALYKTTDLSEIWLSLFEVKVELGKKKEDKTYKTLIRQIRLSKSNYHKLLRTNFYTQAAVNVNPVTEKTDKSLEPTRYGPPPGRPV